MTGNDWNHQFIDVNGIRMHYVRSGRKGAPPLLLLHGWPEFWYTYHKIIPALSAHYDVIAPDLRGFGQTDKPAGSALSSYRLEDHADDMLALIKALNLGPVGIVSHDVGAMVTQAIAQRAPDKLRGLFFFNCPYPCIGARWCAP